MVFTKSGSDHHNWIGDEVTYRGAHKRVYAARGRAAEFDCANDCGRPAREWAYTGGDPDEKYGRAHPGKTEALSYYSASPKFYEALCTYCHRSKDMNRCAEELREYRIWKSATGQTLKDLEVVK